MFTAYAQDRPGASRTWLEKLVKADPYYADTLQISEIIQQTRDWKTLPKEFSRAYFQKGDFKRALEKLSTYLLQKDGEFVGGREEGMCKGIP